MATLQSTTVQGTLDVDNATTLSDTLTFSSGTSVNSISTSISDPGDDNTLVTEAAVSGLTTDDVDEGSMNLYFTDSRAVTAIEGTDPLSLSNIDLSGTLNAPEDQTPDCLTDMTVTSAPTISADVGYTFCIDGNEILGLYGSADGSGGLTGGGRIEVKRDAEFALNEGIELSTNESVQFESLIRFFPDTEASDRPSIGWFDINDNKIAAMSAYEDFGGTVDVQELSFATTDSSGNLGRRLKIPYGADSVQIETRDAGFKVAPGQDFQVGASASLESVSRFYGDIYNFETNNAGFGDKDWETDGLRGPNTKWEFYRQSSTPQLLIHNDDGSSPATLYLRTGTKDWRIKNIDPNLDFTVEGTSVFTIRETGNIQLNASGSIIHPDDSVGNCLLDMDVTSASAAGTTVGYDLCVNNEEFLGFEGNANGSGGLQGDGSISVQRDLDFATDKKIRLASSKTILGDSTVIRLNPVETDDKPAIGWFDVNGNRIAATVAHESDLHYSIETRDSQGALQTRLEVPYGTDQVTIQTQDANFKVSAGSDFEIGTSAGADSIARFWSDIFQFTTDDVGFGDKDWETDGLEGPNTKFEFYRQSSTAQLLIHNDDGSSDAVLFLRSGTTDWKLANEGENIRLFDGFTDDGLELTDAGLLTLDDSWVRRLTSVSSNTTTSGEDFVSVDSSGGEVTITLASTDETDGRVIHIKRRGSNRVTVDTESLATIEGSNSASIGTDGDALKLVYNFLTNDWEIY